MKKQKFYWRKLDDQAKVFALASNNKYSSIFRLSIVLKEKIEEQLLQNALEVAIEKYKAFKVKMHKGLFWYYLGENEKKPIVSIENEYPFHKVNTEKNNDYLFEVSYFENKINIDFFHALTDGNGGGEFFKQIVYNYLKLKNPEELGILEKEKQILEESENAYKKNYKKHGKKSSSSPLAYMVKGEELPKGTVAINHFNINLNDIKNYSKLKECSLSMYITAMLAYSVYATNYKENKGKKPINICLPINLKKYFKTETLSNFFSYMMVSLNLKNKIHTFDDILNMVKKEFDKKMKIEKIVATMTADAGKTNNIFIRIVPLFIKKIAVRLGSLEVKRHFTLTVSNIGKFEIDSRYSNYIENAFVILSPDWAEKVKCGVCSYENNLVLTFASKLKESSIEKKFKDLLEKNNIKFNIEGNGVNVIS